MMIPLNSSSQKKRPPLELLSIKLYSTGLNKVYTNHIYKSMNHNFGVEIVIRNNTSKLQHMKIVGYIYDKHGEAVTRWNRMKKIDQHGMMAYDFYVKEENFSRMRQGKYKIQFWINDKKVQHEYFNITNK